MTANGRRRRVAIHLPSGSTARSDRNDIGKSVTFWSPRRKLRPNDLVEIIYMVGCCCRYQDIIFIRKSLITSPYWLRQRVSTWRGWDPYSNCLDPGSWSDYQSYGANHLSKTGQLEYYTRHACTLFGMGGSNERTSYITWYVHSHFKIFL